MERQYQHGRGRNERQGRERMQGLGGEWYGRDAQGQSRHQHWTGDQEREYSGSGELWDEDTGEYGASGGRGSGFPYGSEDHESSWAGRHGGRGQGGDEFSRWQRYRSGGDHSSFRAGSRSGDDGAYGDLAGDTRSGAYRNYGSLRNSGRSTGSYGDEGYRTGQAGGWRGDGGLGRGYRGDYESTQRSQPYRYGSTYGDEGSRGQSFRGRGPKNYTRSDDRIREDLNEQLMDADDIDAGDVSIEVKEGVVTLSGNVEQRWMKHRIEDMAGDCSGVKDVRNDIRVQSRSDWPYDKQQVSDGLGSTASSQGSSATSGGVSSSSRSQTGSSAH